MSVQTHSFVLAQRNKQIELFFGDWSAKNIGSIFVRDDSTSHVGQWTVIKKFSESEQILLRSFTEKFGERSAQLLLGLFKITAL